MMIYLNWYRREDLSKYSNAVDRHLAQLVTEGVLDKIAQWMYYNPKQRGATSEVSFTVIRIMYRHQKVTSTQKINF